MSASPLAIVEAAPRLEWAPLPLQRPALLLLLLLLSAGPMGEALRLPVVLAAVLRQAMAAWGMAQAAGPMGEVLC